MKPIHGWFRTALGRAVVAAECELMTRRLAALPGRDVVQLGAYGRGQRPALFGNARQWLVDDWPDGPVDIVAKPTDLPLQSESMDLVMLIHQLEFSDEPHRILREAERVLSPEGHLFVIGFNPVSLWGLRRLIAGLGNSQPPWTGHYFSRRRIEDWLTLLGFEITRREGLLLLPPVNKRRFIERLSRRPGMRNARWLGGVQVTLAHKHVAGMTPIKPVWRPQLKVVRGGLAEARSRVDEPR